MLHRLGPPGALPSKPGGVINRSRLPVRRLAVEIMERGGKTDMIELSITVVEAKQQGSHQRTVTFVSKPADDAICCALLLDLEHRSFARRIDAIEALGDKAVEHSPFALEPPSRLFQVTGEWREL